MPVESSMTLVVSTGIGISVIAGILSGVCYVIAHSFKPRRYSKELSPWRCCICECNFAAYHYQTTALAADHHQDIQFVSCKLCNEKACKDRCAKYDRFKKEWICLRCYSNWFSNRQSIKQIEDNNNMEESCRRRIVANEAIINDKEYVRDFIERLVSAMLGGNVDDACITRMYKDTQYVNLFERYHQDLCNALTDLGSALHISITNLPALGHSPCDAHANLKQLIGKLLQESLQISDLTQLEPALTADNNSHQTYEQLLATAILNKVFNTHHSNNDDEIRQQSLPSTSHRKDTHATSKEYYFSDEKLDEKYRDSGSASSFNEEQFLPSDSSLGSTKYVDRLSLTIQQEINGPDSSSDDDNDYQDDIEDDFDHYRPNSSQLLDDGSNWYFQKRHHFSTSNSPIPVPMLVPSPTIESKVLIGDKEIDETTSDLSDDEDNNGVESDSVQLSSLNSLIVESKTIIGGKNGLGDGFINNNIINHFDILNTDDIESVDSGVKADNKDDVEESAREPESMDSQASSNIEKDAEYMEKFESLPRTIQVDKKQERKVDKLIGLNDESDSDYESRFEGSLYGKREKEKWQHPIEMKNNPYTEENVKKRNSEVFGREYYTRLASQPGGSFNRNTKTTNDDGNSWMGSSHENLEEMPNNSEETLHKAIPILIDTSDSDDPNSIHINNQQITSDSDMSLINCYDVESSQVIRKLSKTDDEPIGISIKSSTIEAISPAISKTQIAPEINNDIVPSTPKPKPRTFKKVEHPPSKPLKKATSLFDVTKMKMDEDEEGFTFLKEHPAFQRSQSTNEHIKINNNQFVKRSDNTLLKKIYANPTVRSFALTQRKSIPLQMEENNNIIEQTPALKLNQEQTIKFAVSEPNLKSPTQEQQPAVKPVAVARKVDAKPPNWEVVESRNENDIQITELPQNGTVKSKIQMLSKSLINLNADNNNNVREEEVVTPSVQALRKKFDAMSANSNAPINYSLTARKKRVYTPIVEK